MNVKEKPPEVGASGGENGNTVPQGIAYFPASVKPILISHFNVVLKCQLCGHVWAYTVEPDNVDRLLIIPQRMRRCLCGAENRESLEAGNGKQK